MIHGKGQKKIWKKKHVYILFFIVRLQVGIGVIIVLFIPFFVFGFGDEVMKIPKYYIIFAKWNKKWNTS